MEAIRQIDEAAQYIAAQVSPVGQSSVHPFPPRVAIILGSGLGLLADRLSAPQVIPYSQIPHFQLSTAVGHKGNLIFGTLGGQSVVAMQGRLHYYEGYTMQQVTLPVRVLARLGVRVLMVSNAAGAVNPSFRVGDLMVITDHINLMPNPLVGPNLEEFGPRFPDMTTVYSRRLRQLAHQQAEQLGLWLQEGVYVANTGPTYETPAEYRFYRTIGGDAVGMSTVPEVIVARHCGMEVFGMSVITNQSCDLSDQCLNSGEDVIQQANRAAEGMSALFERMIAPANSSAPL